MSAPARHVPEARDLSGRTFLVTGATAGIGQATAEALGRRGAHVVLAVRAVERATPLVEAIGRSGGSADVLELRLDELASVRQCAERFLAENRPLHALVNNAGIAGLRGQTKDGFELAFGTNHLGHFLLTLLLLPRLREAASADAPARIVNVSSQSHYQARGIDFEALRRPTATFSGMPEYAVSKLANVLFTAELARRLEGTHVHSYALHPGVIASSIWKRVPWPLRPLIKAFMKSVEEGAATSLHCATSPEAGRQSGLYYQSCRERRPSRLAGDASLARELWEKSLAMTGAPDVT
jgi:NAD(P)-dependent dehydrogenase (short-subunit alcohol dehydrogenase family)